MNAYKSIHFWLEKITHTNLISNDYFEDKITKNSEITSFITLTLKNIKKKIT